MKEGDIKKIDSGDFYIIGKQKIGKDDNNLFYNYTKKEYDLFSNHLPGVIIWGVVSIYKNGRIKYGNFKQDKFKNIIMVLHSGDQYVGIDYELVRNNYNYRENTSNGYFYYYKSLAAKDFHKLQAVQRHEKNQLPYNLNGRYLEMFKEEYDKHSLEPRKRVKDIAESLKGLSFGFEFETTMGYVPPRLLGKYGIAALRDGSIAGIEYTTIPLSGEKGVEALIQGVEILKERTIYDNSCSMHLHIGNIPRTKRFITALFIMSNFIQDELFNCFPIVKRFNWNIKNKNYNKPYKSKDVLRWLDTSINNTNLKENFNTILNFLAQGDYYKNENMSGIGSHPADPNNNRKWNINARYYWLNFIPLIFGNRQTVEFRIHTPTFNSEKIISYLLFCAYLINYVKENEANILRHQKKYSTITMREILSEGSSIKDEKGNVVSYYNFRNSLLKYWNMRASSTKERNRRGDIQGKEELIPYFSIHSGFSGKLQVEKTRRRERKSLLNDNIEAPGIYGKPNIEKNGTIYFKGIDPPTTTAFAQEESFFSSQQEIIEEKLTQRKDNTISKKKIKEEDASLKYGIKDEEFVIYGDVNKTFREKLAKSIKELEIKNKGKNRYYKTVPIPKSTAYTTTSIPTKTTGYANYGSHLSPLSAPDNGITNIFKTDPEI